MSFRFAFIVALLTVNAVLGAQRTWIVDAAGGPGHHFKDLPPAVAAARDGDTLLVRKGAYHGFQTSKGITILGASGARLVFTPGLGKKTTLVNVSNLPAGRAFVMQGFALDSRPVPATQLSSNRIMLSANAGRVHLEGLQMTGNCHSSLTSLCPRGVGIVNSKAVTLARMSFRGVLVSLSKSHVVFSECTLSGLDAVILSSRYISRASGNSPAIIASDATVVIAGGNLRGGKGVTGALVSPKSRASAPAIQATRCLLVVGGDGTDVIAAGAPYNGQKPTSAMSLEGGTLWLDPRPKLVPNPGAPAVAGRHLTRLGRPVTTQATSAPPGGTLQITTLGTPGEPVVLMLGLGGAVQSTPYGTFWIDLNTFAVLGTTRLGRLGSWSLAVPVPNIPALRGWVVMFQSLGGDGSRGNPYRLSNPAPSILN